MVESTAAKMRVRSTCSASVQPATKPTATPTRDGTRTFMRRHTKHARGPARREDPGMHRAPLVDQAGLVELHLTAEHVALPPVFALPDYARGLSHQRPRVGCRHGSARRGLPRHAPVVHQLCSRTSRTKASMRAMPIKGAHSTDKLFVSFTIGREPLFAWLAIPRIKLGVNPLIAVRLVSVGGRATDRRRRRAPGTPSGRLGPPASSRPPCA